MKPVAKLSDENGNVFNLLGICTRALKRAEQPEQAAALQLEVLAAGSYDAALQAMMRYCEVK